jgi:hypothetical protein
MAGLVPAIHAFAAPVKKDANARDICAKTRFALLPGHDEERAAPASCDHDNLSWRAALHFLQRII